MKLSRNLLKDVKQRTNEIAENLSAKELYESDEFRVYAQNIVDTITGKFVRPVQMCISHDENNDTVACTVTSDMFLNTANSVSGFYSDMVNRFIATVGIIAHECAHILYLDFDRERLAIEEIKQGEFYGTEPIPDDQEEEEMLESLKEAMHDPDTREIFATLFHHMSNIISDAHDEAKICRAYPGVVAQGIALAAESLRSTCSSLEDMERDDQCDDLSLMVSLILQYARYQEYIVENDKKSESDEHIIKLADIAKALDTARSTDDTSEKFSQLNICTMHLWPYIKERLEQLEKGDSGDSSGSQSGDTNSQSQQSGNSQQGQGQQQQGQGQQQQGQGQQSGGMSKQQATQQIAQAIQQAAGNLSTQSPTGQKSSKLAKNASAAPNIAAQNNAQSASAESEAAQQSAAQALQAMMNAIAQQQAETEVEKQMASDLNVVINAADMASTHKGRKTHIHRPLAIAGSDKTLYDRTMSDIKAYSKTLQKQMENALRDMKDGSIEHHRQIGNIIEARDSYRLDSKFFANKKQPQDLPDMAVAVLVDQSGSMSGQRIKSAMKATMLLDDFATGLHIPIFIAGHNTVNDGIDFTVYTDFNRVSGNDKYRLAKMEAGGANRDGMAINIIADLLSKRPEDVKLLIIISDGQPNDGSYGGESAAKDIREIVKKYSRKGIQTFAAAIGDDKERIQSIYKDGFLDITDLSKLPKTLTTLVKKRLR